MKEIVAIIQPFMLRKVMEALHGLPHFPGVTVSDVRGQGRGRGASGAFMITEDSIDYYSQVKLEMYCSDEHAVEMAKLIEKTARTGNDGDGIVVISDVDRVLRIRTGETQENAV